MKMEEAVEFWLKGRRRGVGVWVLVLVLVRVWIGGFVGKDPFGGFEGGCAAGGR